MYHETTSENILPYLNNPHEEVISENSQIKERHERVTGLFYQKHLKP